MSIVAKFVVNSIEELVGQKNIKLTAVYGNGTENKEWSKFTPCGNISINITNPDAYNQFSVGSEYLVNFEKVEK